MSSVQSAVGVERGRRQGAGSREKNLRVIVMVCVILKLRDRFSWTLQLVGLGMENVL